MSELTSPQAHSHARNAAAELHKTNTVAASEEFDLAAGEFANAAKGTRDVEALRTILLLEKQQQKLAELLKFKPEEAPSLQTPRVGDSQPPSPTAPRAPAAPKTREGSPRRAAAPGAPPTIAALHREPSSSIASNLATARGIPLHRQRRPNQSLAQVSSQVAEGRLVNPPRRPRPGDREASPSNEKHGSAAVQRRPASPSQPRRPSAHQERSSAPPPPPPPVTSTAADDPFARFYATFGSLISTISAPLAFAGLPLNPSSTPHSPTKESPAPTKPPAAAGATSSSRAPSAPAAADADLHRLFSRAALRALQGDGGAAPLGAAESFYVVPATGGTRSYAGMMAGGGGGGGRQASTLTEDDDAEFVDASENPPPGSPGVPRRPGGGPHSAGAGASGGGGGGGLPARGGGSRGAKTYEELAVENESLRAVALDLGDRLRAFELGAQKSSLALHASMRAFSSPTGSTVGGAAGAGAGGGGVGSPRPGAEGVPPLPAGGFKVLEERLKAVEEELRLAQREARRLGKENGKLKEVIHRYREKWETIKTGARGRVKGESIGVENVEEGRDRS